MVFFSKRSDVSESQTMKLIALASSKEKIYNFAAGDPVLENHPAIFEGILRGYTSKLVPYPKVAGLEPLRHRFSEWMNLRYETDYDTVNTLITPGGKFALYALAQILLQEGDEAIVVSPYWVSYPPIIELSSAKVVLIPANEEGKITPEQLESNITSKTKVFILNNGSNPTGVLYKKSELKALLEVAFKRGVFVISDEVYSELVFSDTRYVSCGSFKEYESGVAVVQSFSKNFAMAGFRVGAVFAKEAVIEKLTIIMGQTTSGVSLVSQWAALGALKEAKSVTSYVKEALRKRRDVFFQTFEREFSPLNEWPESAIYAFLPLTLFKTTLSSQGFCQKALEKGCLALVPGIAFGQEGFVRFSFSEREEAISEGLKELKKICEEGL
jgi:aspartate/methionine/tyrosine aminotransferase